MKFTLPCRLIACILLLIAVISTFASCDISDLIENAGNLNITTEQVTVTFDSAGGTPIDQVTVNKGEKISEPTAPVLEGYSFIGWYVGEEKWSFIGYTVTEDMTLTAKWEQSVMFATVTFDSAGGSDVKSQKVLLGESATEPQIPTLTGYKFLGWYFEGSAWDFDTPITSDITLTASWRENSSDEDENNNDEKVTYTVTVLDGTTPVSGVKVQIVNKDTEAKKLVTTDADGKATMTVIAGRYEAAVFYASGYSDYDKSFKDFGADNSLTFNLESDSDDEGESYTYTIYLKDQDGAPISGVRVQICDELCKAPVLTDAEGKAVYTDIDSASFKAQITSAVEGYEEPDAGWGAKYSFNSEFEVTIILVSKGSSNTPCTHSSTVVNPEKPGKPSTCVSKGESPELLCADCGTVVQESTKLRDYGDHPEEMIVTLNAIASTCTTAGRTAGTKCSLCSSTVDAPETLPLLDHTPVSTPYVEPTATKNGHKGGTHCSVCYTTLTAPTVIAAHSHDSDSECITVNSPAVAPTCTTEGARAEIFCSICDMNIQEASVIPALKHPAAHCVITSNAVIPTCTTTGMTAGIHCNLCDTDIQEPTFLDSNPNYHLSSNWEIIPAVAPKCYEDGKLAGVKCTACNAVIVEQALDTVRPSHTYELESERKAPDCTLWETPELANGLTATLKCTASGCTATTGGEVIPFTHVMVDDPDSAKPADCLTKENGRHAGQKCDIDGCTYTEPGEIIYWEHTPGHWIIDTEATPVANGSKHTNCTVCGERIDEEIVYVPVYCTYTVTVLDSEGNAEKKIIAYLYNGNSSVKSVPITNGKATFSNIESGEYRVVLKDITNSRTLVYDESSAVLNADNRDITITVYNKLQTPTESVYFLAEDMADALAFPVKEGTYSVDVKGVAYFVLRASKAGIYTITATASSDVTVVNYGNPQIANRISEGTNVVTIDVPPITDEVIPFVIAIESAEKVSAIVKFERTGDSNDPVYMPWSDVEAENAPSSVYSLPAGTELVDLDVFSNNLSVTLGSDGYYYTADGKLVLIRINSDAQYLGVSLAHLVPGLLESSEAVETFGLYLYDDDGNFLRKENYGTVIAAYYEKCDAELGVVPLTEELADIIKAIGDARGWWDYGTETGFYIFGEELVNEDIAWLFACCVMR